MNKAFSNEGRDAAVREIILDATALLVQEQDVGELSFGDIAAAAEIDEADLRRLYPSLEHLVAGVAERMYQAFMDRLEQELGDDETPGAWTRAFIRASVADEAATDFPKIGRVLLSTVAYKPETVESIRIKQRELFSAMHADGLDPFVVYTVRAAMEGLWMSEMFGMELLPAERKDAFVDHLVSLTLSECTMTAGA